MSLEIGKIDEKRIDSACRNHYLYALQSVTVKNVENHYRIFVSKAPSIHGLNCEFAFMLEFKYAGSCKFLKIFSLTKEGQHKIYHNPLDYCTNLKKLASDFFFKIIQLYNTQSKRMLAKQEPLGSENGGDYDAENLNNLLKTDDKPEVIVNGLVNGSTENVLIYAKYNTDLSVVSTFCDDFVKLFTGRRNTKINMRQRSDVTTFLYSPFSKFSSDEILKLKAAHSYINMGDLKAHNIAEFVEFWKQGKLRKNFEWVVWNTKNTKFNQNEVGKLFEDTSEPIIIRQYKDSNISARLYCHGDEIRFFLETSPVKEDKISFSSLARKIFAFPRTFFNSRIAEKSQKPLH